MQENLKTDLNLPKSSTSNQDDTRHNENAEDVKITGTNGKKDGTGRPETDKNESTVNETYEQETGNKAGEQEDSPDKNEGEAREREYDTNANSVPPDSRQLKSINIRAGFNDSYDCFHRGTINNVF